MQNKIKFSKTSHDPRSSLNATSAKATEATTKDLRLSRYWMQAMQEMNSSHQRELVKSWYDRITLDLNDAIFDSKWYNYEIGIIPIADPTGLNPETRKGRSINVKAIDASISYNALYTVEGDKAARQQLRIIWYVDKQPQTAANVTDVLNCVDAPSNINFVALQNLNNKDRFQILSDEVHSAQQASKTAQIMYFTQHIDLNFITTYRNDTGTEFATNNLRFMICPHHTAILSTAATTVSPIKIITRMAFTDC